MRTSFWLCTVVMVGVIAMGCEIGGDGDDECLTSTPCVDNSDCDSGQHCNTALATPMCQVLYCGKTGSACSEAALCTGSLCQDGACYCEPDCTGLECGPDPECGDSCGTCDSLYKCQAGTCVNNSGWEPDTYTVSCNNGMCLVPEGSFWMGCNESVDVECRDNEKPYHEVTLPAYYMDKTEVTQSAYMECAAANVCTVPHWLWDPINSPNQPVVNVEWDDASKYCAFVGKRLPTEAEWEKAARGTDGRKYPWGNETATCDYAVMYDGTSGCGAGGSMDVCSRSTAGDSPYGLCDMAGNVNEFVSDWYSESYGAERKDWLRVTRGGSFSGSADFSATIWLRASFRDHYPVGRVADDIGFRCAKDAK